MFHSKFEAFASLVPVFRVITKESRSILIRLISILFIGSFLLLCSKSFEFIILRSMNIQRNFSELLEKTEMSFDCCVCAGCTVPMSYIQGISKY